MDPAWSGRGGGLCQLWCRVVPVMCAAGGALPALVPSCAGHVCRPLINLLHYCKVLLDYCIWIVIVVHSSLIIMLLLKLLYLILPLIIFCFIMKNSTTPAPPPASARGCTTPSPPPHPRTLPVNPSLIYYCPRYGQTRGGKNSRPQAHVELSALDRFRSTTRTSKTTWKWRQICLLSKKKEFDRFSWVMQFLSIRTFYNLNI
jgi:hypothetical protein